MPLPVSAAAADAHPDLPLQLLQRITTSDPALKLTKLEIQYKSKFKEAGCRVLGRALSLNTCIANLDLWNTSVGPAGACVLFPAITHLTAMTRLNLWGTDLQSSGVSHLCSALAHLTAMTELCLHGNSLTADDGARICGAAAAAGMTRLQTLGLYGNAFSASDVVRCGTWRQLDLPQPPDDFVASEDYCFLLEYVMSSDRAVFAETRHPDLPLQLLQRITTSDPALTKLEIQYKYVFKEAGCRVLGRALSLNTCITSLDFLNTSVGPAGACVLFPAITHLTAMTHLNFQGTDLQSSGVSHLCSALTHLTSVTHLDISGNDLTEEDLFSLLCSVAASTAGMARLKALSLPQECLAQYSRNAADFWRQLDLQQPPDELLKSFHVITFQGMAQFACLVITQLRYRYTMSLVLNAAAACPVFSRQSEQAHYLQPPEQLGFKLTPHLLEIASLQLWCRGTQQRMQMLCCSCPLSTLALRLACAADRREGHRMQQRVAALIMKRCLSHFGSNESGAFYDRTNRQKEQERMNAALRAALEDDPETLQRLMQHPDVQAMRASDAEAAWFLDKIQSQGIEAAMAHLGNPAFNRLLQVMPSSCSLCYIL
jgi:hypothetical protein